MAKRPAIERRADVHSIVYPPTARPEVLKGRDILYETMDAILPLCLMLEGIAGVTGLPHWNGQHLTKEGESMVRDLSSAAARARRILDALLIDNPNQPPALFDDHIYHALSLARISDVSFASWCRAINDGELLHQEEPICGPGGILDAMSGEWRRVRDALLGFDTPALGAESGKQAT